MKEEHDNRRKWSATTIKKSYYTYRIIDRERKRKELELEKRSLLNFLIHSFTALAHC
jgi:hypothetical protein